MKTGSGISCTCLKPKPIKALSRIFEGNITPKLGTQIPSEIWEFFRLFKNPSILLYLTYHF